MFLIGRVASGLEWRGFDLAGSKDVTAVHVRPIALASDVEHAWSPVQTVVVMLRLDKFKRYPLTFGPTPIEHLPRMTAALGGKVQIYAKRDDCNSGLAMGGNKLRKLEYIVPDAIASNADTLVSIGGVQSNHTRMVAATAAKIGMKCVVIQESWCRMRMPSTTVSAIS